MALSYRHGALQVDIIYSASYTREYTCTCTCNVVHTEAGIPDTLTALCVHGHVYVVVLQ